jgi:hypothetical protein
MTTLSTKKLSPLLFWIVDGDIAKSEGGTIFQQAKSSIGQVCDPG